MLQSGQHSERQERHTLEAIELARSLVHAFEDKQAENIVLLDLRGNSIFSDYFVICTGASERQLQALVDAAAEDVKKKHHLKTPRIEGHPASGWVLVDFGSVIVHAFSAEKRKRYNLEGLWHEGRVILRIQ